jgi:hypothetical protein
VVRAKNSNVAAEERFAPEFVVSYRFSRYAAGNPASTNKERDGETVDSAPERADDDEWRDPPKKQPLTSAEKCDDNMP